MAEIRIFPGEAFRTTSWSGGTTTELLILPEGASYAERRFEARISTASVDIDESVFTPLPGVKRFLTPLCAGFDLTVNGQSVSLPYGGVLEFSGDDAITCRGRGRDLNLMLKNRSGSMSIVSGECSVPEGCKAFVFAPEGSAVSFCSGEVCTSMLMMRRDFASVAPGEYRFSAPVVLFTIEPPRGC